jgi:hypothetical protein
MDFLYLLNLVEEPLDIRELEIPGYLMQNQTHFLEEQLDLQMIFIMTILDHQKVGAIQTQVEIQWVIST